MMFSEIVKNTSHISEEDILKKVSCSDVFVPVREAIKNSLEAIKLKNRNNKNQYDNAQIIISVYTK